MGRSEKSERSEIKCEALLCREGVRHGRSEAAKNLINAIDEYIKSCKEEEAEIEPIPFSDEVFKSMVETIEKVEFKPYVYVSLDGDMIQYYWNDEPDYFQPTSKSGGLYIGLDSGEPVGVQISGILHTLKEQLKREIVA